MDRDKVTDETRASVRRELPEIEEIGDPGLRAKVVEAWALAIANSGFGAIGDIPGSGAPGRFILKEGTQTDHIRGVTNLALRMADEFKRQYPALPLERDTLIAGALCHDVGKAWEFDPANQERWQREPGEAGWPSLRHPAYGAHVCLSVGLPEQIAHIAIAHSREGEAVVRSLECSIIYYADHAYWRVLKAGRMLADTDDRRPPDPRP